MELAARPGSVRPRYISVHNQLSSTVHPPPPSQATSSFRLVSTSTTRSKPFFDHAYDSMRATRITALFVQTTTVFSVLRFLRMLVLDDARARVEPDAIPPVRIARAILGAGSAGVLRWKPHQSCHGGPPRPRIHAALHHMPGLLSRARSCPPSQVLGAH